MLKENNLINRDIITLALIGQKGSGKTTLLKYFLQKSNRVIPTLTDKQFNAVLLEYHGYLLKILTDDKKIPSMFPIWELLIKEADAVIYMIDATLTHKSNPERFHLEKQAFEFLLKTLPFETPLQIFLNKQDLTEYNPIKSADFNYYYPFTHIFSRILSISEISALTGYNIENSLEWFLSSVNNKLKT